MRKTSFFLLMVIAIFSSCHKEDMDAIRADQSNLIARVSVLEEWQKSVNAQITNLQSLITALNEKDYVMGVNELTDGSGYVINFAKSGAITILHGTKGDKGEKGDTGLSSENAPVIGVKEDTDHVYYWTLGGEWILVDNHKMRVTGEKGEQGISGTAGKDAIAPQVRINTDNMWEISTDNGNHWSSTGIKATGEKGEQGDAIFKKDGIDNSHAGYITLTLQDGTQITLPRYKVFQIGEDDKNDIMTVYAKSTTLRLLLPENFKKEDCALITAHIISTQGEDKDSQTRTATTPWTITVKMPTFNPDETCNNDATITITFPTDISINELAVLEVTIFSNNGNRIIATRVLSFGGTLYEIGDYYPDKETAIGVVCMLTGLISDNKSIHGKIISLDQGVGYWGKYGVETGAYDAYNGRNNTEKVLKAYAGHEKYAAFNWVYAKNGNQINGIWYLPAAQELLYIFQNQSIINASLEAMGCTTLTSCWSSTQPNEAGGWLIGPGNKKSAVPKDRDNYIRAISEF